MRVLFSALLFSLAVNSVAWAGGSPGFAAGLGNGQANAAMQQFCIAALRNQMAGGPPAPAACTYAAPRPAYVAPPRPAYVAPQRCVTRPNIPGPLGTTYDTTCY